MLHTSYYGNPLLDPGRQFLVRISNTAPSSFPLNYVLQDAVPPWETIVGPYKDGLIDAAEYERRYCRWLDSKAPYIRNTLEHIRRSAASLCRKDIVLLCYEKPGRFCHRHILAAWLTDTLGLEVSEYNDPAALEPTLF